MSWLNKVGIRKWLRIIHRDLGYFVVGITLVYAISGIILNHKKRGIDPAYRTVTVNDTLQSGMSIEELHLFFKHHYVDYELNKVLPDQTRYQLFVKGGVGSYNVETGIIYFEVYQIKPFVSFINKLHYNKKKHWTIPADFFAGSLIFLALSGLFMVRGKNSIARNGKWYVLAGIVLVVVYIWI
jgi:uncharacterized protein